MMRLSGQFQACLFFFCMKRFRAYKNTSQSNINQQKKIKQTLNNKGNNFLHTQTFKRVKVACFAFWCFLCTWNLFVKNCLILYYWRVPLSFHLSRIYLYTLIFVSLYENKQAHEYHHLKQIFCHQKQIIIFCWFCLFPFYVFYLKFFSFYVWLFSSWTKCLWTH